MKKILVIYFTQTGQAKSAIDATLKSFVQDSNYEIDYELISPKVPFSYPWGYQEFMDAFPENVFGIPMELQPLKINPDKNYDLIFIAYQPWFLSVCRPISSFLQTPEAKKLLDGKPVITIINCRNMWLGAQEKMKKYLKDLNANLVGNLVFPDHSSNLTSLVTVLAFELKGVKEKFMGFFPRYGINQKDLDAASGVGEEIKSCLEKNNYSSLQPKIVQANLNFLRANIMIMEGRGRAMFPIYANYIRKKGNSGNPARKTRVRIFGIVLPTAILLLSPIITIVARLTPIIVPGKMKREIAYYQQTGLKS